MVLILKAFSAGCSSLTGVEAIANAVPQFRTPAVKRAQHTEVALGVLLGAMLLGLAALNKIHLHQVTPRGASPYSRSCRREHLELGGHFYVTNLSVTLVLALAANTSFGGLPVLLRLLWLRTTGVPHLFTLRAERPVFRYSGDRRLYRLHRSATGRGCRRYRILAQPEQRPAARHKQFFMRTHRRHRCHASDSLGLSNTSHPLPKTGVLPAGIRELCWAATPSVRRRGALIARL